MGSPNEEQFFTLVLQDMGAPVNKTNLSVLETWSRGEKPAGDWSQWWNPLNTTEPAPGATSVNSVGVKSYTSAAQGAEATAATIKNGNYPSLADAFVGGAPLSAFQSRSVVTEVENTWGTKLYGSLMKSPNKAAPTPAASSSSSSSSGGGIDLNPVDWLSAIAGFGGSVAGTAAGSVAGGIITGMLDALGGVFSGLANSAAGAIVPLGTALVVTLILVGPRQSQNIVNTSVDLAKGIGGGGGTGSGPAPAAVTPASSQASQDEPVELLDEDESRNMAQEYREYLKAQRAAAGKTAPSSGGRWIENGPGGMPGHYRRTRSAAKTAAKTAATAGEVAALA